jgi:hypothetical protein
MKILITGVGGPTPRSFVNAIKKYSSISDAKFYGTDSNNLAIGLYQTDLFEKTFLVPNCNSNEYWDSIFKIISDNQIEYAIILPETEVLEWSKFSTIKNIPVKTFLPDYEIAKLLVDKAKVAEILCDKNIVPKSISFSRNETDLLKIFSFFENKEFWIRGNIGSSGLGSLKINNFDTLKSWININPKVETFLASEYLCGRNLAFKILYYQGKLIRSASNERVNYIMSKVAPSGITGNVSFGRLINETELVKKADFAMNYIFASQNKKPHGFFTIDFKEDNNGNPLITEINIRHIATTQCFAAGGANFAEDTLNLMLNPESFDKTYKNYTFENGLAFLRDVDTEPIIINENEILKYIK